MKTLTKAVLILLISGTALFADAKPQKGITFPYIDFPMKPGKGMYSTRGKCNMCHSFGYIINQGPQSRKFWHDKVIKMITVFKAPIRSNKDIETVTNYLFENYGNGEEE